jgi:alkanesulfonate monooxygenase SsuD/methylene tetrahydromethanopterin reductase-like flavin-dependent oxidoreductase (luciferase family)
MLRLTAKYADLWNIWLVFGRNAPDQVAPLRAAVDAACADVNRDPATLARTLGVCVALAGQPRALFPIDEPLRGSVEELAATFWAFADEGITNLMLWLYPDTRASIETLGRVIELMDRGR